MRTAVLIVLILKMTSLAMGDDGVSFNRDVRPILAEHCWKCHGPDVVARKAGLRLDTREGSRRGGELGPAVVPGDLDESVLWQAIRYENIEMPPDEKLSDEIIDDFKKWIEGGAADSRTEDNPHGTAPAFCMMLMPSGPTAVTIASPIFCWPNWVAGVLLGRIKK